MTESEKTKQAGGLRFVHISDVPSKEVVAQMHGERRAGVHLQILEWSPARFVAHTRYDPGLILARHAHKSAALIFILDGEVQVGDRRCSPGTLIVLEKDVFFGPLIAGPEGCVLIETYGADVTSVHEDDVDYKRFLAARGITPVLRVSDAPPDLSVA